MKLLAIDSSAKSASVAVTEDGKLLSECFVNVALTHSCTLMPMVSNALMQADMKIEDIDAFCVNAGPGSFTGIRIGVAAVKGLAFSGNRPCAPVSTLESMAYNFADENCIVCSAMDARCSQVYTALFECADGEVKRLCEDKAESMDELIGELKNFSGRIYIAGDGAELFYGKAAGELENIILPAENRRYQRAYGVALATAKNKNFDSAEKLVPVYLRPPQAERELKIKLREKTNDSIGK